jgi:hypothetical protein
MPIDYEKKARRLWPYLVRRANSKRHPFFYTYKEAGAKIGLHYRAVGHACEVIGRCCRRKGWPALQRLVINARQQKPGSGYWGSPRTNPALRKELAEIHKHHWPTRPPSDLKF